MFALFRTALRAVLPSTSTINNERNEDKETSNSSLAAQLQNIIIETTQSIRGHINRMHSFLLFLYVDAVLFPLYLCHRAFQNMNQSRAPGSSRPGVSNSFCPTGHTLSSNEVRRATLKIGYSSSPSKLAKIPPSFWEFSMLPDCLAFI